MSRKKSFFSWRAKISHHHHYSGQSYVTTATPTASTFLPTDRRGREKGGSGRKKEKQIVVAGSESNVVVVAELLLLLLSRGASDYTRSFLPVAPERKSPPCSGRRTKFFFWLVAQTPPPCPEGEGRGGEKRGGNFLSGRCVFS